MQNGNFKNNLNLKYASCKKPAASSIYNFIKSINFSHYETQNIYQ